MGKVFLIQDTFEKIDWNLQSDTKNIGKYTCFKATAEQLIKIYAHSDESTEKSITITAWYTPQIPVSAGPERYWGLPGLILEINAGRTTMLCTEIVINPEDVVEIKKPTKGKEVSRDEYDVMMKKKSEELREQFQNRRGGGRRF